MGNIILLHVTAGMFSETKERGRNNIADKTRHRAGKRVEKVSQLKTRCITYYLNKQRYSSDFRKLSCVLKCHHLTNSG